MSATLRVTLDGSGSSDPEASPLTFTWSLASAPQGSAATFEDATAAQTDFVPDLPGAYSVQLVVNDGTDDSEPDQATITAIDNSAAAVIGAAGGEVQSKDGDFRISVPPGALNQDTEITVTLALTTEEEAGPVYDLAPSGLEFAVPATVSLDVALADLTGFVDENGDPLDPEENLPDVLFFLLNDDETIEELTTSRVEGKEDGVVTLSTEIPHFTGLLTVAGNGVYVYMASLGTHYVGPSFKRDVDVRYLGYAVTSRYRDMSIDFVLNSLTVTLIEFDVGLPIKIESPNPVTRNDFLNQRGQTSSTRPRFFCDAVGDATVGTDFSGTGVVQATFKPENKTRSYQVSVTETTARKGKCIAPLIGLNDTPPFSQDDAEETAWTAVDAEDDVLLVQGNNLEPATGLNPPGFSDLSGTMVSIVGDPGEESLYASFTVRDMIPVSLSGQDAFISFDFMILDPTIGHTGSPLFEDVLWDLGFDAAGSGSPLMPAAYGWNGSSLVDHPDVPLEVFRGEQWVALQVPLEDLGLTLDKARNSEFRVITQVLGTRTGTQRYFADRCVFGPITDTSAFATCP